MSGIVTGDRPRQALRQDARRRRARPRRGRGRDLRPRGSRTAPARRRRCGSSRRCSCPTAGDAEIAGASVRRNPNDVRRVLGFMPDSFGVYDDMKVWEYLDFFARCYGIPAERRRRMIGDLLELVDLGPKRDVYVQGLSRGMQQRLCLAHTLVHDPQVLLLDEPASGLDPRARVELRELLRELRSLGKTILVSSPHPPRARGAVHLGRDHRPRAGARPGQGRRHREAPARRARCCGSGCWATTTTTRRPAPGSPSQPDVVTAELLADGQIEIGFHGDDDGSAAPAGPRGGCRAPDRLVRAGPRATSRSCSSRSRPRRRARWGRRMTAVAGPRRRSAGCARSAPAWPRSA